MFAERRLFWSTAMLLPPTLMKNLVCTAIARCFPLSAARASWLPTLFHCTRPFPYPPPAPAPTNPYRRDILDPGRTPLQYIAPPRAPTIRRPADAPRYDYMPRSPRQARTLLAVRACSRWILRTQRPAPARFTALRFPPAVHDLGVHTRPCAPPAATAFSALSRSLLFTIILSSSDNAIRSLFIAPARSLASHRFGTEPHP